MTTRAEAERRAAAAAGSLLAYAERVSLVPGTRLARSQRPSRTRRDTPWNYWWQAHFLDAVVDAGDRELRAGDRRAAGRWLRTGHALLRGIGLRNRLRYTNEFYDDMAWLALAALRLDGLGAALGRRPSWLVRRAHRAVAPAFDVAATCPWGGCWWNREHDFANTPASAPIALYWARTGRTADARRIADWLAAELTDPDTGLVLDGLRVVDGERRLSTELWSYNQGTVLGLSLALGGPADLARAAELVAAIATHLTVGRDVLRTEGTGDGGLFTGILARYLALAAADERLPAETRAAATRLVHATADALWAGRRETPTGVVLPVDPASGPAGPEPIDLTPQLQAWTVLEAAASL